MGEAHHGDAAIYVRISDDKEGREAGVTRQTQDARALAARDGRDVPDEWVFSDNDISASTRSKKPRPAFDRLLALVEAGQVRHVYAYSASRLTRRPAEFERLIQLAEQVGVTFHVVTGHIDLGSADGRMLARMLSNADTAEAERIGERVARQKKQRAEQGMPQGGRFATFGFDRSWAVVPEQADKVREAFRRRASGESVGTIAKNLGVNHGTLVAVLRNPIYAGLRRYKGAVVGELHPDFPRLVDRRIFDAAQAVAEARPAGTGTRKYLLSGIARCAACNGRMKGAPASGRAARYRCAATYGGCGKTSIRIDWVDYPVLIEVVAREVASRYREDDTDDPSVSDTAADAARADIAQVQAAVAAGQITLGTALPLLSEAEGRLRAAEREQRQAAARQVESNWTLKTSSELLSMSLGETRALLARHLSAVVIAPSPTVGRNVIDLSRVTLVWADGTEQVLTNDVPGDAEASVQ